MPLLQILEPFQDIFHVPATQNNQDQSNDEEDDGCTGDLITSRLRSFANHLVELGSFAEAFLSLGLYLFSAFLAIFKDHGFKELISGVRSISYEDEDQHFAIFGST